MRSLNQRAEELELGVCFKFRTHDQARKRNDPISYRGVETYAWLGYAYELALATETQEKIQTAADVLNDLLKRFGL